MKRFVEATWVLEGELRERDLLEVGERLARLTQRGCRWVVLDFFEVPHVDYRGVPALLKQAEAFREAGGGIVLTGLTPYIAKILQVGGARPEHFDCFARIEDAWSALGRAERRYQVAQDEAAAAQAEALADEAEAKAKVIQALAAKGGNIPASSRPAVQPTPAAEPVAEVAPALKLVRGAGRRAS